MASFLETSFIPIVFFLVIRFCNQVSILRLIGFSDKTENARNQDNYLLNKCSLY